MAGESNRALSVVLLDFNVSFIPMGHNATRIYSLKLHLAVSFQFPIAFASTIDKVVNLRQFL